MWQNQGKNQCLRKSSSIYEYWEKKNDYECIFQFSVYLLPINMDVS